MLVDPARAASITRYPLLWSDFDVPGFFLHACARTDHSVSEIIIFKSAAGSISFRSSSISFRSTVSQSCSIHACVGGPRPRAGRASALRWRCRRLAAACPVRLVGDIRHATAVFHKVFGQENKPGAPVTSSQGARDTNVRPPNRAWEERARPAKLAAGFASAQSLPSPSPDCGPARRQQLQPCSALLQQQQHFPAGASSCPTRRPRARA